MTTITIPKQLTKMGDLVIVPRKEYEKLQKAGRERVIEEKDTNLALSTYKKEKRLKKLKIIKSLADLD